ncbi:MAG: DUF885 family protein [Chthoniobacterales bacterium]|nr:DUF885 family protein [Chthoniobacterales bacterium]
MERGHFCPDPGQLDPNPRIFRISLDPQTQLSWTLFEQDVQTNAEGFRFRFHNYPVNQTFGWHANTPTFLINIHRVDSVADAEAYIARLNGVAKQADQLIANLELRAERGSFRRNLSSRSCSMPAAKSPSESRSIRVKTTARCSRISRRRSARSKTWTKRRATG